MNFYGIHLCHKHNCDIRNSWVCWPLGLLFTCVYDITIIIVYKYLALSITSQHTLFPMLTTAPLDRAFLVPSKSFFPEDSKSKVSYIEKVKFHNFILTQNALLMYIYLYRMLIISVYMKFKIFNHL